jgi:aspartate kinase
MGGVTFLGRGSTDTTAVALAAALAADACELYTDVAGVYTADPRLAADARMLSHVHFDEMLAMCAAGCPKPATDAVELARERGVSLHVCSAVDGASGTWIDGSASDAADPIIAMVADWTANQLARFLHAREAVSPGHRVALLFDDTVDAYAAMLAVLKVRAAYVPLEPGFPPDRSLPHLAPTPRSGPC